MSVSRRAVGLLKAMAVFSLIASKIFLWFHWTWKVSTFFVLGDFFLLNEVLEAIERQGYDFVCQDV